MMQDPDFQSVPPRRDTLRRNSIYLLPNAFTLASLFCAFFALIQSVHGQYVHAAWAVLASALLDGMDGRVARLTNSQSPFGEQFDSLADMVAFGVAPAFVAYNWQLHSFGYFGYAAAFVYCSCAAFRLARFNTLIGKSSKKWFIGVPSPAAAALMAGLVWLDGSFHALPAVQWLCLAVTLFAGLSMVAPVRFWSFKEINSRSQVPLFVLLLMMAALLVLAFELSLSVFVLSLAYCLSGYVMWWWQRQGRRW